MRHLIYFILLLIPFWTNAQLVETVVQDIVSESVTSLVGTTIVNLVINSGASGTTDWVDTNTDGIADDWVQATGAGAPTIVTGNGFLGNAQRVNHVTGTQTLFRQLARY